MYRVTDFFGSRAADFPLLVLLCVSGAAAARLYYYYYYYKQEHVDSTEDPVQMGSVDASVLDPDLMPDVDGLSVTQTVPKDPRSETEKENQEVEVTSSPVEQESHRECERKNKECEQQRETYCVLESQYDYMALTHNEEFLKVSLAEAEKKYEQGIKTMALLEKENSELKSKVNTLQDSVQELGMLLSETHTESSELSMLYENEVSLRKYMQHEYDKSEEKLNKDIISLKVNLAEAERKYDWSMESNTQQQNEITFLSYEVNRLQGSVQQLEAELSDTHTRCNELTSECVRHECEMSILQSEYSEMKETLLKDCEREPEVHRMLLAQNDKLKKLLKQKEGLLKDSLAEAERKYDQAISSKAQLEYEKSHLMSQVNTLQGSVQKMEKDLSEMHSECEVMKREREVYSIQKLQCEEMRESLEQCKELLKECGRERESHSVLTSQCNPMALLHNEATLMLQPTLAEAKKKYEQAEMTNAQLENEKLDLVSKVNKLQETVGGLSSLLSETHRKCDEAMKECASARGILEFVQTEAKKQARALTQENKSLEVALADAKNKYEEAMESNYMLENELSNLASDLNRLEARLIETEEELFESKRRCEEVTAEHEQKTQQLSKLNLRLNLCKETTQSIINDYQNECQAHEALKVQYDEMKERHDELQKVTLAKAEEYPERGIESSVQLDNKKSVLMSQVNTLQNPVQQLQEELSDTKKKCDEIMREREQEQEAYSVLKMQYQRLQEKFERCQGILRDLCTAVESEEPLFH